TGPAGRARARRPVVVGSRDPEGVRPPRGERQVAGDRNEGIAPLAPLGKARRGPRLSNEGIAPLAPFGKAERGPTPRGLASLAGGGPGPSNPADVVRVDGGDLFAIGHVRAETLADELQDARVDGLLAVVLAHDEERRAVDAEPAREPVPRALW